MSKWKITQLENTPITPLQISIWKFLNETNPDKISITAFLLSLSYTSDSTIARLEDYSPNKFTVKFIDSLYQTKTYVEFSR